MTGLPAMNVRVVEGGQASPLPAMNVRVVSGGGGGGGGGAGFDRTLYCGTVEFNPDGDEVLAALVTPDENVLWYAQWGKIAELKFRATVAPAPSGTPLIPSSVPLVRLRGLGLFADNYHELVTMLVGSTFGTPDAEAGGTAYPALIQQVNPGDWRMGYDLVLQQGFYAPPQGKAFYMRAAAVLTSAMYFLNGQCILDDPQYVQAGSSPAAAVLRGARP